MRKVLLGLVVAMVCFGASAEAQEFESVYRELLEGVLAGLKSHVETGEPSASPTRDS